MGNPVSLSWPREQGKQATVMLFTREEPGPALGLLNSLFY